MPPEYLLPPDLPPPSPDPPPFVDIPPGSLFDTMTFAPPPLCSSDDGGPPSPSTETPTLPVIPPTSPDVVHITGCPRVCGITGDTASFTTKGQDGGLTDSGANICLTNDLSLLTNVHFCTPFTIEQATNDGNPSSSARCDRRGFLPVPLLDGTVYNQTCYYSAHASDTFISPQVIIDGSTGMLDTWIMMGSSHSRDGSLRFFSPSGLTSMSIPLTQRNGLYYCPLDISPTQ